jgi:acyl-CoA synthetase (AMP-forming)/AMP-acid ligase II
MYPIDFFYRCARLHHGRIAIESSTEDVSYGELAGRVDALAYAFQRVDPAPQSRVGICAYR